LAKGGQRHTGWKSPTDRNGLLPSPIKTKTMYTQELWDEWSRLEEENYKLVPNKEGKQQRKYLKKGYQHFDPKVWFPNEKQKIQNILKNGLKVRNQQGTSSWYSFAPFIKTLIKTPRYKFQAEEAEYDLETKTRPISYASHMDSLIFGYYSFALTKQYENFMGIDGYSTCVLAYRSNLEGKCNIQFAKEVFDEVKRRGECTAIALDIKGYFDSIDHEILLEKWKKIVGGWLPDDQIKIFKALTTYNYVSRTSFLKKYGINLRKVDDPVIRLLDFVPGDKTYNKYDQIRADQLMVKNGINKKTGRFAGVPQGSPISALLSNIYLVDFDKMMYEKSLAEGFFYRRYSDDILIVCDTDKAKALQQYTIDTIKNDYWLTIQDKKVELTEFKQNSLGKLRAFSDKKLQKDAYPALDISNERKYYNELQYLGFEFNGQRVIVRPSSLSRYFRKMTSRIVKTTSMAYSGKVKSGKVWTEQLLHRYSHLGKRNFLTYVYNASRKNYTNSKSESKPGMNDPSIRRQVRCHVDILKRKLAAKNMQRFLYKRKKHDVRLKSV
jgi:RNA-directed DNA polymerase